jgi:hypothetical protein
MNQTNHTKGKAGTMTPLHHRLLAVFSALLLMSHQTAQVQATAPPPNPAELTVEDSGDLFSPEAITKAKKTVAGSLGQHRRQVHIETFKTLSDSDKKDYEAAQGDKKKLQTFWNNWAKSKLVGEHGILILVIRSPGHVVPLVDRQMRDAGFSEEKEEKLQTMLLDAFHKAKAAKDAGKTDAEVQVIRDEGLQEVAEYLKTNLPESGFEKIDRHESGVESTQPGRSSGQSSAANNQPAGGGGISIGGCICIGLVAFVGIWLVFGIIRAFSGGMGGGGMGGGMGGGGMGGGGFFPSLLGGMFGGLAGGWIYDRFFGSGGGWGGGPYQHGGYDGGYGGSGSGGGGGDMPADSGGTIDTPGGGDFSGDSGGGGDFGGDIGGGGGDFGGGGGDGGGGGGDF